MTTQYRRFKDAIYEQFARIASALASPKRLELLDLLCQGERTVEVLAKEAGLTVANASQHLQVLRSARLVEAQKVGVFVTYRLADPQVTDFYLALRSVAEQRLAEVERITRDFWQGREGLEAVNAQALLDRLSQGAVTLVDVRPVEEYRAGHIPGAISVPLKELQERLSELPQEREIVAYCRGPYCVLAPQAVELLRAKGFKAHRLSEGVPDWRARGFAVAPAEGKGTGSSSSAPRGNPMQEGLA